MATPQRLRMLHITRNLPPLIGGMERLNWHMAEELCREAEVCVIGPKGSAEQCPSRANLVEVPLRPLWRFLLTSGLEAVRAACRWRPHVVLAGSGLTAPIAWVAARCCGAKTTAYLHGLDLSVRHPAYQMLWLPFIRRMDRCIVNSTPTLQLALEAGVAAEKIRIVHPGVSMPQEAPSEQTAHAFKARYGLENRTILLSVGRLSRRKGLLEFVEQALPTIVQQCPDVLLVVIGGVPKDALHPASNSGGTIRAAAQAAGVLENVKLMGNVSESDLLTAYQVASLHVFPVCNIAGDPEGFGMVAIEAASHGLPTVAFATGGVTDAVAEGQSGRLVNAGDYDALARAVLETLADGPAKWGPGSITFAQEFAWSAFGEKLRHALPLESMVTAASTTADQGSSP
ncbi:glycosyltransferase family 4 protein [Stenotrophomonas acidaminiphila]|uniref:glycosyltransferase family 4 protein n=2 Tax=Stenotrophomonas acidaminiphila TaxID=128780 RepID=UPI0028B23775|nr:glycosyltransferase family 4 protein [Stenotrophomonas acidaminiphila]